MLFSMALSITMTPIYMRCSDFKELMPKQPRRRFGGILNVNERVKSGNCQHICQRYSQTVWRIIPHTTVCRHTQVMTLHSTLLKYSVSPTRRR